MPNKWLQFGHFRAVELVAGLFYTGLLPLLYAAYCTGRQVTLTHTIMKSVRDGDWYTGKEVPNVGLGILWGLIVLAVYVVVWKLLCEILLLVLRYFERSRGIDKPESEL